MHWGARTCGLGAALKSCDLPASMLSEHKRVRHIPSPNLGSADEAKP